MKRKLSLFGAILLVVILGMSPLAYATPQPPSAGDVNTFEQSMRAWNGLTCSPKIPETSTTQQEQQTILSDAQSLQSLNSLSAITPQLMQATQRYYTDISKYDICVPPS